MNICEVTKSVTLFLASTVYNRKYILVKLPESAVCYVLYAPKTIMFHGSLMFKVGQEKKSLLPLASVGDGIYWRLPGDNYQTGPGRRPCRKPHRGSPELVGKVTWDAFPTRLRLETHCQKPALSNPFKIQCPGSSFRSVKLQLMGSQPGNISELFGAKNEIQGMWWNLTRDE